MGKDEPVQISPPFLFCGLVLCLRALDRPILGSSTALVYAALAALPFAALAWWFGDKRGKAVNLVAALVIGLIFSGGAVVSLNRVLDSSSSVSDYAKVNQKYVSGSRSKAYILSVFTKQAPSRPVGFAVDASTYERASVGDTLLVQEHKGAFGLPWFDLRGLFSEPSSR